ncbi:competence protein ComFA [Fictibacillus solisalsi]|uniref:Competence protein ComFA n=1 Tax=Fictibacillus solisalsi TaxID=459525 RepID=A0A1G9XZM3_9BACL|nr:DEAD/DEAH box helicase [Fictibacillus solisalsi]SDN02312.1 competence protein ComFA [Fictibacillus solisalsi]
MRFVSFFVDGKNRIAPEPLAPRHHHSISTSFYNLHNVDPPPLNEGYSFNTTLQAELAGKLLLLDELSLSLNEVHDHYDHGYIRYNKGIDNEQGKWKCNRCGNNEPRLFASFSCYRCKEMQCVYCRNCIMMGRVSQCTPLVSWIGPSLNWKDRNCESVWEGMLSSAQENASLRLEEKIGVKDELLIWAVCGAGKTEVLFQGIEKALKTGQRVCIATPRTDVVLELLPRLRKVFPGVTLSGLYGGSMDHMDGAQLILSTTHQLFRFRKAFDLIIVDEVDAFPFSYDKTLAYAVQQAQKAEALIVYLSATPDRKMKQRAEDGKLPSVKIPKRYHGFPLPVPHFLWCGHWKKKLKKNKLPGNVMNWINHQLERNRQGFLFVPSVRTLEQIVPLLKEMNPLIEGVHAEDPDRKEKVIRFRNGETPILVTTTILERGVTVPFTDVAVLGTEEEIFTESALVQIAGRAGRSKDDPAGEVLFYHYGKTTAMVQAKRHIEQMNREAGL